MHISRLQMVPRSPQETPRRFPGGLQEALKKHEWQALAALHHQKRTEAKKLVKLCVEIDISRPQLASRITQGASKRLSGGLRGARKKHELLVLAALHPRKRPEAKMLIKLV